MLSELSSFERLTLFFGHLSFVYLSHATSHQPLLRIVYLLLPLARTRRTMELAAVDMVWALCWGALGVFVLAWTWRVADWVWWTPRRLGRALRAQGLRGTPYRLLFGDLKEDAQLARDARAKPMALSHHITPRVFPFFHRVMEEYGKISFTWFGTVPRVTIMDPELIREILSSKFGHFEKQKISLFGRSSAGGLATYEGEKWAKHRRIINPAFHLEKLKRMMPAFSTCCDDLINRWEHLAGSEGSCELDVWPEFQNFTGDVISRTAFGSNFEEGQHIFHLQTEQVELLIQALQSVYIPGYRFLPTSKNIRRKEISREIDAILRAMIEKREKAIKMGETSNEDLLGLLLESNMQLSTEQGNSKSIDMTTEDVIGECKLFYFAGHETTSVLLTWTMVVLSMHPSWQIRAREEVVQVFGKNKPDLDGLNRLKITTMILYEVLRLYPPVSMLTRRTYKTMELGGITYPPGVLLSLPVIFIHHDAKFWGEDAGEFNPERFAEGVSKASKNQVAFFPFGWGPRICIGQNFAIIEAKLCLCMILQHFSFELAPSYAHAPRTIITLRPQYGAQIMLHRA